MFMDDPSRTSRPVGGRSSEAAKNPAPLDHWPRWCIGVVCVTLITAPSALTYGEPHPSGNAALGPVGWQTYRHPERLAALPSGSQTRQFSSFDRTGGNDDGFTGTYSCLRVTGQGCVIAEHTGPGEIDSIWFNNQFDELSSLGDITIILDGRTVLHAPLQQVVEGTLGPPFVYPLVATAYQSSGGFYIKVPMPFRSSMRVITDARPLFYHVTYRQFADAEGVRTFDPATKATDVLAKLRQAGSRDPKPPLPNAHASKSSFRVGPGKTRTLATESGPGAIAAIALKLPQLVPGSAHRRRERASARLLSRARLQIRFDGHRTVDAPLGEFFGTGLGLYRVRALMFAADPRRKLLHAWWLMPYRTSATVRLHNGSNVPIRSGHIRVRAARDARWRTDLGPGGTAGYFHASGRRAKPRPGHDYRFLRTSGGGRVVGVSQTMVGQIPTTNPTGLGYLEGDERLYVDGARSPDMHGTGTEDFYEGGVYFLFNGPFTNPLNGNPAQRAAASRCQYWCTSAYRLLLADGPDFQRRIDFGIEHGAADDAPASYSSTTYWYGRPDAALQRTDSIDIGSAASERAHGYTSEDSASPTTLTSTFEGNDGPPAPFTHAVRASTTPIRFRVAVDPANRGVELRRTSDQARGYQTVLVRIDGQPAGRWTEPLANRDHRWLDDTDLLPPELTAGKRLLHIMLIPVAGAPPWTAARYAAMSSVRP